MEGVYNLHAARNWLTWKMIPEHRERESAAEDDKAARRTARATQSIILLIL